MVSTQVARQRRLLQREAVVGDQAVQQLLGRRRTLKRQRGPRHSDSILTSRRMGGLGKDTCLLGTNIMHKVRKYHKGCRKGCVMLCNNKFNMNFVQLGGP